VFLVLVFTFNSLISHDYGLNFLIKFSDFSFFVFNFNSNSSNLLRNFLGFVSSFVVLSFHNVQFVVKTRNDVFLTLNLGFEISLEISETDIISCFASFQILNLSLESNKISFIQFI
jgi:hypothetical protein